MKIRQGFVSNSSSSSFVMRAISFSAEELIKALSITEAELTECEDDDYDMMNLIGSKLPKSISVNNTGNFFGDQDYENLIVGVNCGCFEDGEVEMLAEHTPESDKEIYDELDKFGLTGELRTYVQMISNDNY